MGQSQTFSPRVKSSTTSSCNGLRVCTMSDEEYYEEEEVTSQTSKKGEGFLKAKKKKGELDEQLREYINEWRKQRGKEEEELKRLKEKQAKRKEIRAEQEKKLAQQKKEEEERLRKEEADKKAKEAEEKRKRLEEAEKKRQAMMQAQKEKQQAAGQGAKGTVKKADSGMGNVQDARREMAKTKEQLEEEKKISLSIRIKPLELDGMDSDGLKAKASELWDTIVKLETERYDLEEKVKRQDYDLKELKERQRQQNKQKAIKLGLDPEALTGKYPPKIRMYSKYERRTGGNSMRAVGTCCTRSCWRRPGRRRWTTGARDPRPSCPSGSERGPARSPETPSPLMMRMRDRLRLPRVLRKRKRRKRKRMRRRRKRRSKSGQIVRQEEPPNWVGLRLGRHQK